MRSELTIEEMCARYGRLYVAAIADVLDDKGLWHQVMHNDIKPLQITDKVVGVAHTALGKPERSTDRTIRLGARMIDGLKPFEVAVFDCSDDQLVGHWGELLANGAATRGVRGAVVDGGVRDTAALLDMNFPVFHRYRTARDAKGRWNVVDTQQPIVCGGVPVRQGDFIVGDCDGVIVIPQEIAVDVLTEAEKTVEVEQEIRDRVRAGESVGDLYLSYDRF